MPFWPPVRRSIVSLWVMASSPLMYSGDVRTGSRDSSGRSVSPTLLASAKESWFGSGSVKAVLWPVLWRQYWTAELSALLTNRAVLAAHKDLR